MNDYSAKKHYENLLARHYSWMFGDFNQQVEKNREWFVENEIKPHVNHKAVDLGCGSGFQSVALSSLEFDVTAVDFNRELLDELKSHDRAGAIDIIQSDILEPEHYSAGAPFELAVCMGDTLPHLPSLQSVSGFFKNVHKLLETDGKLILGFRDLSAELTGTDRFIPVQSDSDKMMTVFLEYKPDYVHVHDLIYERDGNSWKFEKSVYKKLRLSAGRVENLLEEADFSVDRQYSERGLIHMIATKQ